MQIIDIHEAKTHLSLLVEQAVAGKPFVIAKAGKPLVKVMPLETPGDSEIQRIGFLDGQINIPDDFDQMSQEEIEKLFGGSK